MGVFQRWRGLVGGEVEEGAREWGYFSAGGGRGLVGVEVEGKLGLCRMAGLAAILLPAKYGHGTCANQLLQRHERVQELHGQHATSTTPYLTPYLAPPPHTHAHTPTHPHTRTLNSPVGLSAWRKCTSLVTAEPEWMSSIFSLRERPMLT